LSLPDGVSTQWAAAYLYGGRRSWWRSLGLLSGIVLRPAALRRQIPERFGGTVFAWQLLEAAATKKLRIYLIGSPSHSKIETAAQVISGRLPALKMVGTWPGRLGGKSGSALRQALEASPVEADLVADLRAKRPDIILVGMGFPLQEELMAKLTPQLKHGVLIGEGGTFDYDSFGGGRRKAPPAMQRAGLEWLWRLVQEPARWHRQLAIPRFTVKVYRSGRQS
jgi:N-acetylglucosaminyldiphosphoundecaprenol N-acetyl-beta-D-mannosaminyltransferase